VPRVLTVQRTLVTPPDRERYAQRLERKREHYQRSNCRFWVFEERSLPGAFLEFFEGPDEATLQRAHAAAPEPVLDPNRVYMEVEFT
jgi:hypothetical protein